MPQLTPLVEKEMILVPRIRCWRGFQQPTTTQPLGPRSPTVTLKKGVPPKKNSWNKPSTRYNSNVEATIQSAGAATRSWVTGGDPPSVRPRRHIVIDRTGMLRGCPKSMPLCGASSTPLRHVRTGTSPRSSSCRQLFAILRRTVPRSPKLCR
jgi:hypothetical protein